MSDESTSAPQGETKFCWKCGEKILKEAEICPKCGVNQNQGKAEKAVDPNASPKSRLVACLLAFFLAPFGVHRFYVGKIGSGVAMIFVDWLTLNIWGLVDLILICCGKFTDKDGKLITNWDID